jgi:glycosyltransferase involved in cell wall biosynthesis
VRVLHIVTNLDVGGAQTSVVGICAELRRRGVDVHLAHSSRGGRSDMGHDILKCRLCDACVPVHDVPEMLRSIHPLHDGRALRRFQSLIRELRPTIVHTHMSKAGVIGRTAAVTQRVPTIIHTVRGWSFYVTKSRILCTAMIKIERALARRTHRLFSVTEQLVRDGLARNIGHADRYSVVRSGICIRQFQASGRADSVCRGELDLPPSAPIVGSVMGLTRQKAPLDFVATCERVAREIPDAHFVVVGDGPLRGSMSDAIGRCGLRDRFRLVGLRRDVPSLLRLMDVFLLTSHWEGLARVLMEAVAAEVPIVATDVGGVRDLIDHGRSGFVAPVGRVDVLATHVVDLLSDETMARSVATTAAKTLSSEFDMSAVVSHHESVYDAIRNGSATIGPPS